jgi:hypothetical protein
VPIEPANQSIGELGSDEGETKGAAASVAGPELPEPLPVETNAMHSLVAANASILSSQQRCALLEAWGYYVAEGVSLEAYRQLPDDALERLADTEDDGYAQYLLATRIRNRYWDEYFSGAQLSLDEQLARMKQNYAKSVRSHNVDGARWLMAYEYRLNNKVEAAAWQVILEDMVDGSPGDAGIDLMQHLAFTEQEKADGEDRALELISELDLTPGLSPPEVCN